jgi:hypothetical protein
MAAQLWGAPWLYIAITFLLLIWSPCVALVLLNKILASTHQAISVRIRLAPWPGVDITTSDAAASTDYRDHGRKLHRNDTSNESERTSMEASAPCIAPKPTRQ